MKAMTDDCERFISFPPGHIYSSKTGALQRWYNPQWFLESIPSGPYDPRVVREGFEKAVIKRLMTDVPFGVLLSGGLDSSLVASVVSRHMAETKGARQWGSKLHTFCVGLKGSPDLKAAKEVSDFLGTTHHEFHLNKQDATDALEEVIYHMESYEVAAIRSGVPMFLMSRKIKSLGIKMVLSGEGSDELFGGYLYFHKAPSKEARHLETCRKVRPDLGWIEKWVLRNAFDDDKKPYLPKHILFRQKEQFSDGVGYNWIDILKDHANANVSDAMLMNAGLVYPENTPTTKEGYLYRSIFERFFPKNAASTVPGGPTVAGCTPTAVMWDKSWSIEPSGRAVGGVHASAFVEGPKAASHTKDNISINGFPKAALDAEASVFEATATAAV